MPRGLEFLPRLAGGLIFLILLLALAGPAHAQEAGQVELPLPDASGFLKR